MLGLSVSAIAAKAPSYDGFDLDAFMGSYYQHPDPSKIPQAINAFASSGDAVLPGSANPALAFFSLVFSANPKKLPEWQKDINEQDILSKAILGQAVFYSHDPKWIVELPYHTATTNDMYWAAYFASGDPLYVRKVIKQLVYCDERTDVNLYLTGASAQWSLAGNAANHPDVRAIMEKASHSATGRVQKLLVAALQQTPEQIRNETISVLKAGKAAGNWKDLVPWRYKVSNARTLSKNASGNYQIGINYKIVDYLIEQIGKHLANYPPRFTNNNEKIVVLRRLQELLFVLDSMDIDTADSKFLRRVAQANAMAYNVDVPGSYQWTTKNYALLLKRNPNDADANYNYGKFLAQTATEGRRAIPFLLKARKLGILDADYTLGMVYITLGDKDKAIKYLESYQTEVPDNAASTHQLIDSLKSGKIKIIH